jgi:mannosyl-3-phosphoglycerate phosphatase family protein
MKAPPAVVFTDLDGSLLNHDTHEPGPAAEALRRLKAAGIPVVFCSAKTAAEQMVIRRALGIDDPYVVENGAAIRALHGTPKVFGLSYDEVRDRLALGAARAGVRVRGYGDMSVAEVSAHTGLDRPAAARAMLRDHTESFILEEGEPGRLREALAELHVRMLQGWRFWTALGPHHKGTAIRYLSDQWDEPTTYGIGEHANDLDLLAAVDVPLLVQSRRGTWIDFDAPRLIRLPGIGPEGWCLAADRVLDAEVPRLGVADA